MEAFIIQIHLFSKNMCGWFASSSFVSEEYFKCWLLGYFTIFGQCRQTSQRELRIIQTKKRKMPMTDFLETVAPRAFRRPLTTEEYDILWAAYISGKADTTSVCSNGANPQGAAAVGAHYVMTTLFNAPQFLYHAEIGDENGELTAYELASRLSYHFWDAPPDDELWTAAEDGRILTEEGYAEQVER